MQVIDYGLTKLDDHYSWASGWVETQLAEQRLRSGSSVSSSLLERGNVVDGDVVAAATDPTASQRLAARQARKLQRKWNKPGGFEWCELVNMILIAVLTQDIHAVTINVNLVVVQHSKRP